jgi:hypothetical protein
VSNIDWSQLKTAQAKAAEQAKDAAVAQEAERSALTRRPILAGPPSQQRGLAMVARLDAIERLLGLKPLRAEG